MKRKRWARALNRDTGRLKWFFFLLGLLIISVSSWPSSAAAKPGVWVDPAVRASLQHNETAPVLVILRDRADLSTIPVTVHSRDTQGDWVMESLQQVSNHSQRALRAFLDAQGVPYRTYWIVNMLSLSAGADLIELLSQRQDVARIVSNAAFPVDLGFESEVLPGEAASHGIEPDLYTVNAPALWDLGVTGENILIGIADTGVGWEHEALKAHYAGWDGSSADHNYHWWDAIHDDSINDGINDCGINLMAPCDDYGHGTHVTGIAVGDDGAANQIGVAPGAKWIACRNMDDGFGTPATYIECYQFFLAPTDLTGANPDPARRPHIVNSSFACPTWEGCTAGDELHTAVEALRAAGVFMAVSAGNDGPSCGSISTPPALEESAFTIGAVGGDLVASFSSRGPVTVDDSLRLKPDLVAPGVSIRSSLYFVGHDVYTYGQKSGTSMAAPHVAGGVALLWSAFPELMRQINQTEWLLSISAEPLYCGADCCAPSIPGSWPNTVYGYGRMDLLRAYQYWQHQIILTIILNGAHP